MFSRASLNAGLEYQRESLKGMIAGLTDEQVRREVLAGKWSIFENIAHLATYQHAFLQRISRIVNEQNPVFGRYNAESDPLFHDYCTRTTKAILDDLVITRNELVSDIRSLDDDTMLRTGEHPVFGKMNLLQWLNFFLLHEAHHLFTIFKLMPGLRE